MPAAGTDDYVRDFVEEVLRTGIMLIDVVGDLIEEMPEDAFPGESNAEVVVDMLVGTVRPVADAAGREPVRSAIALITGSRDRLLTDLERALEIATRLEFEKSHKRGGRRPA
jgi:hypothetical protein